MYDPAMNIRISGTIAATAFAVVATVAGPAVASDRPMTPAQVGGNCTPVYSAKYHEVICVKRHAVRPSVRFHAAHRHLTR